MKPIDKFVGSYRFLSNFYPATVVYEKLTYPSVEHAFQAAKAADVNLRPQVFRLTAGQVKLWGRGIKLRDDWIEIRVDVMRELVRDKFFRNHQLAEKLIKTGNRELIEGNWWNGMFWGVCKGVGQNQLGKILMEVRKELTER